MKPTTETHPCACGCGKMIHKFDRDKRPRRYAQGHFHRGKKREKFGGKVLADQPGKN